MKSELITDKHRIVKTYFGAEAEEEWDLHLFDDDLFASNDRGEIVDNRKTLREIQEFSKGVKEVVIYKKIKKDTKRFTSYLEALKFALQQNNAEIAASDSDEYGDVDYMSLEKFDAYYLPSFRLFLIRYHI